MKLYIRSASQVVLAAAFLVFSSAQAALIDRGGGLIYDTVLNITWMQNANLAAGSIYDDGWSHTDGRMSFANATNWVDSLSYYDSANGLTITGWRLPDGVDLISGKPSPSLDGFVTSPPPFSGSSCDWQFAGYDCGWNMAPLSSELVHLFYVDLGNLGSYDTAGHLRPGVSGVDWGTVNTGPFINVDNYIYWSTIINPADPTQEWRHFKFNDGRMSWRLAEDPDYHAWAVHDGDVGAINAVPEPETYALLLAGLGLLGFVARRRKQQAVA